MSDVKFAGQVALVTGASRGIGAAIALELAQKGLVVIGTATSEEGAAKISQTLAGFPGCGGRKLDVNDGAEAEALIEQITKAHGGLQVLVNNAGITRDTLAMRMKDDDWDAVLDTNLKAVFRMSRAVMRTMMKQRYGRIISITSVVGASGNAGQANYAAAKAGVAGMTRALARELASRNITVNCVAPGFIATPSCSAMIFLTRASISLINPSEGCKLIPDFTALGTAPQAPGRTDKNRLRFFCILGPARRAFSPPLSAQQAHASATCTCRR
jgi:3-oxoacyl-[acyl-carrier protein] reductase